MKEEVNLKTCRIRLKFTKEQEELAWDYAYAARRFWNVLVDIDRRNNKGEFDELLASRENKLYHSNYHDRDIYRLSQQDYLILAKMVITQEYEADPENYAWYYRNNQSFLYTYVAKEIVQVRKQNKGKLNFRAYGEHTPSFNVTCCISADKKRPSRIYLKASGKLQIPTIGEVEFGSVPKGVDLDCKKQTAQINFDGKYWYLCFTYPVADVNPDDLPDYTDGVGIDLGIKILATMSDGTKVPNIKQFRRIRILNKRIKRLQRKLSRKYLINQCDKHNKTKNIKKLERKIKLIHRSIRNIRINHIRKFVADLVKKQPAYITVELLNVTGMMKNKHLAKDIQNCSFYTIREHLTRKAKERFIAVRLVDRFYPSSKLCSSCGHKKSDLKLSDRTYRCPDCHLALDRDLNAAINLANAQDYTLA